MIKMQRFSAVVIFIFIFLICFLKADASTIVETIEETTTEEAMPMVTQFITGVQQSFVQQTATSFPPMTADEGKSTGSPPWEPKKPLSSENGKHETAPPKTTTRPPTKPTAGPKPKMTTTNSPKPQVYVSQHKTEPEAAAAISTGSCPCAKPVGSSVCLQYDLRYQAANIEEALFNFRDQSSFDPDEARSLSPSTNSRVDGPSTTTMDSGSRGSLCTPQDHACLRCLKKTLEWALLMYGARGDKGIEEELRQIIKKHGLQQPNVTTDCPRLAFLHDPKVKGYLFQRSELEKLVLKDDDPALDDLLQTIKGDNTTKLCNSSPQKTTNASSQNDSTVSSDSDTSSDYDSNSGPAPSGSWGHNNGGGWGHGGSWPNGRGGYGRSDRNWNRPYYGWNRRNQWWQRPGGPASNGRNRNRGGRRSKKSGLQDEVQNPKSDVIITVISPISPNFDRDFSYTGPGSSSGGRRGMTITVGVAGAQVWPGPHRTRGLQQSQPLQPQSAAEDPVLSKVPIECKPKGSPVHDHTDLCRLCDKCWQLTNLKPNYFPRIVNEVSCGAVTKCLKGFGECLPKMKSLSVLRNEGTPSAPNWREVTISVPMGCECTVRRDSALYNVVIG